VEEAVRHRTFVGLSSTYRGPVDQYIIAESGVFQARTDHYPKGSLHIQPEIYQRIYFTPPPLPSLQVIGIKDPPKKKNRHSGLQKIVFVLGVHSIHGYESLFDGPSSLTQDVNDSG
jgi:hypothetical protein